MIKNNKRYFTLIELIIIIVVIGILAGMALPKFTGVVKNSKVAAMITDIDTLEKAIMMYQQDNDTLPLLEETKTFGLQRLEENDMTDIYPSLQEALKLSEDSEDYLYKINLDESGKYHTKTKYGHGKTDKDFYVYSTKSNRVYYYGYLKDGDDKYNHNEIPIVVEDNELVKKIPSKPINNNSNQENETFTMELISQNLVKNKLSLSFNKSDNVNNIKILDDTNKVYFEGNSSNIEISNLVSNKTYNFIIKGYINEKEIYSENLSIQTNPMLSKKLELKSGNDEILGYINTSGESEGFTNSKLGNETIFLNNTSEVDFTGKYLYTNISTYGIPVGSRVRITRYDTREEYFYDRNQVINFKLDLNKITGNSNTKVLLRFEITNSNTDKVSISTIKIDY